MTKRIQKQPGVARCAKKLAGSPPSAGSSADLWAAKSASSQQKRRNVLSVSSS